MIKPELTTIAKSVLELNYQSDEPIKTLLPLKGGEWSSAYKFGLDGDNFVIRLSHTAENFYRDKIASQWSSSDLPIPQIISIDRYQGQNYAISPFFDGEAFEMLSVSDLEQTIPGFLSMMTALQSVNLNSVEGYGTISPEGKGAFRSWAEALLDVENDRPDSLTHGWKDILAETPEATYKYNQFYKQLTKMGSYASSRTAAHKTNCITTNSGLCREENAIYRGRSEYESERFYYLRMILTCYDSYVKISSRQSREERWCMSMIRPQ